ncbi:monocarboxylate transporter 13 isoform X2 [Anabrus simplex]|uniref:monocarboxylate transporter 13 isoform X2 n=1 Tax=Anabrus simplex TaxID=316456 RepID=UPI0035A3CFEB
MEGVPDGGWGWMVVCGMAGMFMVTMGVLPSFGIIFGDFLESLGEGTTSVTSITSVYISVCFLTGLPFNSLSKSFSFRQIGAVGAIIHFLGALLSSFAQNVIHLIVTYGLLQGFGLGLMIPAALSSFNSYFSERRTRAMAISQTMNGAGSFLMPLLVQLLVENYGFRGAQFLMAAITLHSLLGMMLLRPVEGYMKTRKLGLVLVIIERDDQVTQGKPLVKELASAEEETSALAVELGASCKQSKLTNHKRTSSMRWNDRSCVFFRWIVELFDLSLLKDPVYINITIGVCFTNLSDITFFALEPIYLEQILGFTKAAISIVIAIGAAGDLLARVFLIFVSCGLSYRNRLIFFLGAVGTVVTITVFVFVSNYYVIATLTGILGFCRGCIYISLILVFSETIPAARFPSAIGLYHGITGVVFLSFGPLIGLVRDVVGSYPACFLTLSFLMSVCVLLWAAELVTRILKLKF